MIPWRVRLFLWLSRIAGMRPFHQLSVSEARREIHRFQRPPGGAKVGERRELIIPGPGGELAARLYTPAGAGPFGLLLYLHGGGWVLGDLDGCEAVCRAICARSDLAVLALDYRLAPEHKYPAALEDTLAALRWAEAHAGELGADPARLLLGGESAGGNLAAAAALRLRDEGGPRLSGQLLVYPVLDYHTPPTRSYLDFSEGYFLTRADMQWFWSHYLHNPSQAQLPTVAPLQANDLSGLPPALLIIAGFDPLHDEGAAYARRLQQAGTPARLLEYPGAIHGFLQMQGLLPEADQALGEIGIWLRQGEA